MTEHRRLSVFLCHAREDDPIVAEINQKLEDLPWVDPWVDDKDLLPGQEVESVIDQALSQADVVLLCLSTRSVKKAGYVQKEVKLALKCAEEKPEGTIYLIPLFLDDCELPYKLELKKLHWAKYASKEDFGKILESLKVRAKGLGIKVESNPTLLETWLKWMKSVWKEMQGKQFFQQQIEKVRKSLQILQTKENWQGKELKERLKAAVVSLILPGLGLYFRGRNILAISLFVVTIFGYFAVAPLGFVMHLISIGLSVVLEQSGQS